MPRRDEYILPTGSSAISASPGFTWGRSGNVTGGTYLLNDTVPSDLSGRLVPLYDAVITEAFVANENNNTFVIAIEIRVGAVYTELCTVSVAGTRTQVLSFTTSVNVTYGDELCCKVKSGSAKNPVVGIIIKGDSA